MLKVDKSPSKDPQHSGGVDLQSTDTTLPNSLREDYLAKAENKGLPNLNIPNPFKAPEYTTTDRRVSIDAQSARKGAELHGVLDDLKNSRGCMQLTIRGGAQGAAGISASRAWMDNDVSTADPSLKTFVVYRDNHKNLVFAPVQHPTTVGDSVTINAPKGYLIAGFVSMREPGNANLGLVANPIQRTLINVATVDPGMNF